MLQDAVGGHRISSAGSMQLHSRNFQSCPTPNLPRFCSRPDSWPSLGGLSFDVITHKVAGRVDAIRQNLTLYQFSKIESGISARSAAFYPASQDECRLRVDHCAPSLSPSCKNSFLHCRKRCMSWPAPKMALRPSETLN